VMGFLNDSAALIDAGQSLRRIDGELWPALVGARNAIFGPMTGLGDAVACDDEARVWKPATAERAREVHRMAEAAHRAIQDALDALQGA